jgi:hypothetical protein
MLFIKMVQFMFLMNNQDDEDMIDDIIHEIAHSVEEAYHRIYL